MDPVISQEVGEVDDLEEFGLAEPSATITMRFNDGSSVVCLIGDSAPSDEETRYLSLEGSSYVYIVGSDHHLLRSAAAYADLTVVEACLLYTSYGGIQFPYFAGSTVCM